MNEVALVSPTETWARRRRRTRELAARYPFAAELLRLYEALLDAQEPAFLKALDDHPEPARVAEGHDGRIHLLVTVAKLLRPGRVRTVAAESLLLKHQLLIISRSRQRAPNLTTVHRLVLGLTMLFVSPH